MYLSSTRTAELWPDTLKGALRAVAIAAVFLALAAALLYVLSPGLDTWPRLLVFHESVGLTMVACLLLLRHTRAFARFKSRTRWLLTGVMLYLLMTALPLSGWLSASTPIVPWKLWWIMPWPAIAAPDQALHAFAEELDEFLFKALIALLIVHVAAALQHHFLRRNDVLLRMWRGTR